MNKQRRKATNLLPFIPDGEFYFTKGVQSFQKQKFDLSLKWLHKAIELKPNNPLYNCQLSIVYTEIGKYHKANELLNHVLHTSDYVDCYYLLANNYAHLGLLNDSKKFAELYLEKEPDGDFSEEALMLLELINFEMDEEETDDWLVEEEDDLLKYQETVFYHMENEEWDKALPIIEEMLLLFPDHLVVKHDYAQALFHIGEEEKAMELEKKIQQETDYPLHSIINLAQFYYERGDKAYKEKISELRNVFPIHTDQRIKLAVTFAKTGHFKEAYERFQRISKPLARGHLSYFKWFAIAAYYRNRQEFAKELWEDGCMKHRALRKHVSPWQEHEQINGR